MILKFVTECGKIKAYTLSFIIIMLGFDYYRESYICEFYKEL